MVTSWTGSDLDGAGVGSDVLTALGRKLVVVALTNRIRRPKSAYVTGKVRQASARNKGYVHKTITRTAS